MSHVYTWVHIEYLIDQSNEDLVSDSSQITQSSLNTTHSEYQESSTDTTHSKNEDLVSDSSQITQ